MRGQSLRDGSTSYRPRIRGVWVLVIAGIWLGGVFTPLAHERTRVFLAAPK